ncbi:MULTISPECIES: hypothetical protein [Cysteiniphilum]|uniref:Uncharacterized protein n=1 Tax=Cysteiniphilum litorale TaxID=2056700 RepID=A0A8J2Z6Q8_9GAMM|nr:MULTISPECIES: hypothetical protein [Cysteiniphilum]GGG06992.1 hypothetical protein GCM10010995_25630 [Cysteiniphilum litorale]
MAAKKKTPQERKADIQKQIDELKKLEAKIDKDRADKVGKLALKYGVTDLEDDIIEKEFKAIAEKYKEDKEMMNKLDDEVKKSSLDSTASAPS